MDLEPAGDLLVLLEGCSSVISGITVAVDFLARGLPRGDCVVGVSILGVNGGVAILREKKEKEKTKLFFVKLKWVFRVKTKSLYDGLEVIGMHVGVESLFLVCKRVSIVCDFFLR